LGVYLFQNFTARRYASAIYAMTVLSVCLSVCLSVNHTYKPNAQRKTELNSTQLNWVAQLSSVQFSAVHWVIYCVKRL